MSEWDEADLGDFFLLKACLKELRSYNDNRENKEDHEAESFSKNDEAALKDVQEKQYRADTGVKQQGRNSVK